MKLADLTLFNSQAIRDIEARVAVEHPGKNLMKKAGRATAILAKQLIKKNSHPILMIAGPGNNGGDACATAADLAKEGFQVIVILCADTDKYTENSKKFFEKALSRKVIFKSCDTLKSLLKQEFSLIIDGMFGIGLTRPINGINKEVIITINQYAKIRQVPILSIDIPSGLHPDTGTIIATEAEEGACIEATCTLTFLGNKPGLYTADGKDYAGQVLISDLDVDATQRPDSNIILNDPTAFTFQLPRRKQNSHKGDFGQVLVIGGAKGMVGASILAGRTALYAGAGKTTLGFLSPTVSYDPLHPEIMCHDLADIKLGSEVIVIGPGLGKTDAARHSLTRMLQSDSRLVIDADALNLISADQELQEYLKIRNAQSILTPHPLEAARLLQQTTKDIQSDRLSSALSLAEQFKCTIILKGTGSIICNQLCDLRINTTGNAGLATGGTGDVLAGLCGALMAQGLTSFDAAQLATWLHGAAADYLSKNGTGPIGMNPSELPEAIRHCLNVFAASQKEIS